jgi:hypothetical protein
VSPYVLFIVAILLPTAVGYAAIFGIRGLRWAGARRPRRAPAPEPIERLAQTLRRLRAELEAMETRTGVPNKNVRVNALRGAYLDALRSACQRLEVPPPGTSGTAGRQRANQAEIYRVEAGLRQRGLDVREPAAH